MLVATIKLAAVAVKVLEKSEESCEGWVRTAERPGKEQHLAPYGDVWWAQSSIYRCIKRTTGGRLYNSISSLLSTNS
jgi:hypothetical protein